MTSGSTLTVVAADQLPALAMSSPDEADRAARAVLSGAATPLDQTYALQALGIVQRERGEVRRALRTVRRGIRVGNEHGLTARVTDLEASLGTVLALAGRRRSAFDAFDSALEGAEPAERARILVRRAAVCFFFQDLDGARQNSHEAAAILERLGDTRWEATARTNLASALLGLGRFADADAEYGRSQELAERAGHDYLATIVVQNRGDCAHRMGDLPRALRLLYDARRRYEELGVVPPEVLRDLAVVQLAAGLTEDAATTADELVAVLEGARDSALRRSDGFIAAAIVHLAAGNAVRAADLARRAARSSRRQGHDDAERHARVVLLRAQAAAGAVTKRHARAAAALAAELTDRYASERLDALVLAGRLALATGLPELAEDALRTAAAGRRGRGSALRRATGWYAQALLAESAGDRRAMLRACGRGLDVLDTHALSLGATELRARATVHGSDLAALATRRVAVDGSARELLRWTERWRGTLHSLPWPEARHDAELTAELGRLRAVGSLIGTHADEAERRRIEERIRRHVHGRDARTDAAAPAGHAAVPGPTSRRSLDVRELLDTLGGRTLVSIVGLRGGRFHAVVAREGRLKHVVAGESGAALDEVEYAKFALRGAAVAADAVAGVLLAAAEPGLARLQETMLGPAVRELGDGPVVLVPPSTMQSVPWGALPALRDRDVTVAPSATAWLRARTSTPPADRRVALIAGADLASSGAEVGVLAGVYTDATVLTGGDATADAALDALDGSWLAHVGAHGRYRGDNPMFSSLELADGPLTVFDIERLQSPPYRLLLTACESGVGSPTGADELLGLTTSLSALGTAGLLATVVPVSDAASVDLSLIVHERLREGDDLGAALLAARRAAAGARDRATAWSFLALGGA
ncbi:CHAT domain-containing protein [Jiangella aurantiaca]|uniref:CHAT domain-containing protein n=1 Tax=Jiangella aurantiaca TaxID=2530373 RepID=A0A4R5A9Y3_9ACTN|nr:CHAT domain-containing protein [Jiangella aurantiaca]TDD67729.1 CHAT domain-containing protein [Jiangella aurantiaca]